MTFKDLNEALGLGRSGELSTLLDHVSGAGERVEPIPHQQRHPTEDARKEARTHRRHIHQSLRLCRPQYAMEARHCSTTQTAKRTRSATAHLQLMISTM